jgi:hypothetical protein
MKQKLTVKLVYKALLILFLAGCSAAKDPHLLSHIPEVRELEKEDHKICTALKLNFDGKDNFLSRAYWQCRLSFAKYRLRAGPSATPEQARRDANFTDLVAKISLKVSSTPEAVIIRESKKMDEYDHKKCLAMGFVLDTEDLTKVEDYFSCRKVLLDEGQLIPPYGNLDYLPYSNRSYGVGFVVDQRITKAINHYNEMKEKYPTCISFGVNSPNFKRCVEARNKALQCYEGIPQKKFRREGDEKVICQKRAYLRFGDDLIKKDEQKKRDIERTSRNSDFYNDRSLASIGATESDFVSEENKAKDPKEKTAEKINSKAGLYEKFELTKLRQKFVIACQQDAAGRVDEYVSELKKSCDALEKFEILGEE